MSSIYGIWKHNTKYAGLSISIVQTIREDDSYETHMVFAMGRGGRKHFYYYGTLEIGDTTIKPKLGSGKVEMVGCKNPSKNFSLRELTEAETREARNILEQEVPYTIEGDTFVTKSKGPLGKITIAYERQGEYDADREITFADRKMKSNDREMKSLNLTELANQYRSDKGTEHLEKHGYTLVYEQLFSPLKSKAIAFLEIGLCIGGPEFGDSFSGLEADNIPSICMWTEYFENARIYGFDINDFAHLESEFKDFKFIKGDLSSERDLTNLVETTAKLEGARHSTVYDTILDDGSHASFHQQQAFSILFPCLKPNGIYIIEDLHWQSPSYEEKLPSVPKTLDLLVQLKNIKNGVGILPENYLFREAIAVFLDDIDSIEFYCNDKLAVIRKGASPFGKLAKLPAAIRGFGAAARQRLKRPLQALLQTRDDPR